MLFDPAGRDRLELEAAAMTAAARAGVSVPIVHEVVVIDGRPGLVMDRIHGEDLLTILNRRPWRLLRSASELGRLQARLHDVSAPSELPDLRQTLLRRIESAPHLPSGTASYARELLAGLPDGDRICHGDFHPGNVVVGPGGMVLIDWSNAARGDPMADVARTIVLLRIAAVPGHGSPSSRAAIQVGRRLLRRAWVRSYRREHTLDPSVVRRWETVGAVARLGDGIGDEVEPLLRLIAARERRS